MSCCGQLKKGKSEVRLTERDDTTFLSLIENFHFFFKDFHCVHGFKVCNAGFVHGTYEVRRDCTLVILKYKLFENDIISFVIESEYVVM